MTIDSIVAILVFIFVVVKVVTTKNKYFEIDKSLFPEITVWVEEDIWYAYDSNNTFICQSTEFSELLVMSAEYFGVDPQKLKIVSINDKPLAEILFEEEFYDK